jgi:transposase InsO family protein
MDMRPRAAMKAELLHGRVFTTAADLRTQLARYARYYKQQRLHSALGYRVPVDYERGAA